MENNAIEIRALIIADICGSLSKEEQDYLHHLIEEHPEVRALEQHLIEALQYEPSMSDKDMEEELQLIIKIGDVQRNLAKRKKLRIVRSLSSAAALVLLAGIWLFTSGPPGSASKRRDMVTQSGVEPPGPGGKPVILAANNKQYMLEGETCYRQGNGVFTTEGSGQIKHKISLPSNTPYVVKVPAGRTYNIALEDGTTISVNSATEIFFKGRFESSREIEVRGEAKLNVAHDPSRPFTVVLNKVRVQVLGTVFNVNTYHPSQPEVSLYSGDVKLTGGGKDELLHTGSKATFNGYEFQVDSLDAEESAWSADTILLANADEQEIVEAFERYFDQQIVFDTPLTGTTRLKFNRKLPVAKLLQELPGEYRQYTVGNVIHLRSNE